MFWKKKIVYETRQVYSIRQELERLRPFVCPRQSEGTRMYTEADIRAAEERLGYQLPVPVRELYLVMGDIISHAKGSVQNAGYTQNQSGPERTQPNYTFFFEFNRIYLWGPVDPLDPVVYVNVQNGV